jgi:hypothetical protein
MKRAQVEREIGLVVIFAKLHAQALFRIAERAWQNGYCVQLKPTQGPDPKRLGPGQTTHFTIEVFHKPDNVKLDSPVVATGSNGKADPAAKPVPPPAKFSFTADGGKPKAYAAWLTSTSRRGIGMLTLNFSQQGYKIKVTFVSGPSDRGMPNTVPLTVEGTVAEDTPGSPLIGPGQLHGEGYTGQCKYDYDSAIEHVHYGWTDAGPISLPVTLKATDKGLGNMELSIDTRGALPLPTGTFPAEGGTVTHNFTYQDCGPRAGTETIVAEPIGG